MSSSSRWEDARAAASDPRALSQLVRAAFRNSARYYVELARAPIVDRAFLERWLVVENAAEVDAILAAPGGKLFVGMHLGWFELPALIGRDLGAIDAERPNRAAMH